MSEYFEPIMEKTIGYEAMNAIFKGQDTWNNEGGIAAVAAFLAT